MEVRFGVLGPLRVWRDGAEVGLPAGKHRALLAALLLRRNRMVPVSDLIAAVWDAEPPLNARATIQTYVGRLRRFLDNGLIATRPDGYLIEIGDDQLDLARFERLVECASSAADPTEASALLAEALALWRGPALADVPSEALHRTAVPALTERRLAALERRIELDLAAGHSAALIAELRTMTAEYPLRERFWAQLMRALAECGRQAEALQAYRQVRDLLASELGVDPDVELQRVHQTVLRGTLPRAVVRSSRSATAAPEQPRPAQLPPDVADFTGRASELRRLDLLLGNANDGPRAVVISAIEGMAGIGKTALAVHWSHRVRERFPDGQLYVDLRGYGSATPLRPLDALSGFLQALGVPAERLPDDVDAAAALYRSIVADRRILILVDNAASADQVRPLLPGGRWCMVVVTSRDRLGGLVARDGAQAMPLDLLTPPEAHALLRAILSAHRTRAEPEAVAELARLCGHLPLALRIAAANVTAVPGLTLTAYNARLRDSDRLAALAVPDDKQTAVKAAFDLSYHRLPAGVRRMFRLLSLAPGTDIYLDVPAVLADLPADQAELQLAALTRAHLVDQPAPGRYTLHDLLRRYAADCAEREESVAERTAARDRIHQHYLRQAAIAARMLYPQVLRLPDAEVDAVAGATFAAAGQALAWLDRERPNLVAVVVSAAVEGQRSVAWRLADCLRGYLWLRRCVAEWPEVAGHARAAAEADGARQAEAAAALSLGDLDLVAGRFTAAVEQYGAAQGLAREAGWHDGQAAALGQLGVAYRSLGQPRRAAEHHAQALALYRKTGRQGGEAVCLGNLGVACEELGQLRLAAQHTDRARALFRRLGSRAAEANALGNLGRLEWLLGRLDAAAVHLGEALALHREQGQASGEATALIDLAALHRDRDQLDRARELAAAAVALTHEISDRYYEAAALNTLADVHLDLGQADLAIGYHQRALDLARDTGDRMHTSAALTGLAAARRRTGSLTEALTKAYEAQAIASHTGLALAEGSAELVLAEAQLDRAEHDEAVKHARTALAIHARTGYRLGQARAHSLLSRILTRTGDTESATEHRRCARLVYTDLGLHGLVPASDQNRE